MRTIGFDARHRLNSITYPEATVLLSHTADTPLIDSMSRTPAGGGASHTVVNDYDGDVLTSKTIGTDVFSYRQDSDFRLAGVKLNEEPEWVFVHDDDDLVIAYGPFDITRDGPGGAPGTYSDGVMSLTYTFDDLGRLTDRAMVVNGTTVYAFGLGFEAGTGRISQREESIGATAVFLDYGYTPDGELAAVQQGATVVESYAYDVNGNRTTANGITFIYDNQDRLLTAGATSYVFDENGLLATRGNDGFVFSSRGELLSVAIDGGETVSYGYDALGRRVSRTDSGGTTHYLFGDPNNPLLLLASRASDGSLTRYYYDESDILIGFERDGNRFYVASDQVGTPRLIVDAAGVIIKQVDYDSFGMILADSNAAFDLPIGYAGGLSDHVTGLIRFGFRDYEPASGRWTARDPLLFNGGQFNLYAYASSNPVSLRDPSGLFCVGYSYYTGYGAGGKFCFNLDGTVQACGEVGIGVGGGVSIDLNASAKEGVSNYVKGEASVGCGPVSAGVNASLDNCGNAKVCAGADAKLSMPAAFQEANDVGFKAGGSLCYDFLSKELSGTGPFGASVSEKSGSNPIRESSGPQKTVNFGGRIKCKGTAGVKGGGCIGTKLF
jgi:RHS repeat-associated protein